MKRRVPKADQFMQKVDEGAKPGRRTKLRKWAVLFKCRNLDTLRPSKLQRALLSIAPSAMKKKMRLAPKSPAKIRSEAAKGKGSIRDLAAAQCYDDHGVLLNPPSLVDWLYEVLGDVFSTINPLLGGGSLCFLRTHSAHSTHSSAAPFGPQHP